MIVKSILAGLLLMSFAFANTNFSFLNTNIEWMIQKEGTISSDLIISQGRNYNVVSSEKYLLTKDESHQLVAHLPVDKLLVGISVGKNLVELLLRNLNFVLQEHKNSFSIETFLYTDLNNKTQSVTHLEAICGSKVNDKNLLSLIFSSCFNNGSVKIKKAMFPDILSAEDIALKVESNEFQLNGYLTDPIQGTTKIKGISNYDLIKNELIVEVQSAKLEFLNIRSRLFKELKKITSKKITVREPFVIISF